MTTPDNHSYNRILIVKPSSLGDVVHALPALHALRQRFPSAHIAWLIAKPFAPLIQNHPDLNEIITFDRKRFARVHKSISIAREFYAFLRDLRSRHFDLVLDFQGLFRSAFFTRATGSPARIGFKSARESAPFFYTHKIPTPNKNAHAVDKNLLLCESIGCDTSNPTFNLAITDAEQNEANDFLKSVKIDPSAPYMAVLPGARWETKLWPPERFATTIDAVAQNGLPSILMGGESESSLCAEIADASSSNPRNIAGKTSIRALTTILRGSRLVLTHDSAPMHLAVALHRPLVAILGPTSPYRTGPYNRLDDVIQADLDCSPCYLRNLSQCPHNHECMKSVMPDEVIGKIEAILRNDESKPGKTPV